MVGQIIGAAALASAVTVGAYVVQDILGDTTPWGGIATATATMGTAVMAQVLSRIMMRRGRRPGLQLGYALASVGALLAAFGAQHRSLALLWWVFFSLVTAKLLICLHDMPQLT